VNFTRQPPATSIETLPEQMGFGDMNRSRFIPPLTRLLRNSCATDFSLTPGTKRKLSLLDESIGCILLNDLRQVLPNSLKRPEVGYFCPTSSRTGMGIVSGFLLSLTLFSLNISIANLFENTGSPGVFGEFLIFLRCWALIIINSPMNAPREERR